MEGDDAYARQFTSLSKGVLEQIMNGSDVDKPVFQILGTRRIGASGAEAQDRFRLLISDGKYLHSFAMLATQLNPMQNDGLLPDFTIIQVNRYITSMVNQNKGERRVIILLELDVLHDGNLVNQKLHNPVQYGGGAKENQTQNIPQSNSSFNKQPAISNGSAYNQQNRQKNTANQSMNASSLNEALTHPISSLSPYQNKWVIKARVTAKSAVRTWSNAKGEGKLFSMDLMDETGEIRATAFRDQVDKYYDMIEVDKVYYISRCVLKPANKQYSSLKNDYEMTFNNDTIVQECEDEVSSIPQMTYDLTPISQISEMEQNKTVDVLGVAKEVSEVQELKARSTGRDLIKREVTLVDQSNASISLTLWGETARTFDAHMQPVLLVKGARVTEYLGGKTLGMISGTVIKTNPDIPEGHRLRGWFDNGGAENVTSSLSARTAGAGGMSTEWMTFYEAKERNLGSGDKGDFFQTLGYVHSLRPTNAVYKACPQPECNKKVVDQENGSYRCEKCNADFPNFKYRLLCNMLIGDWTGNRWCTVFSDVAEQLLGKTSQEVGEAIECESADEIFSAISFKSLIFKFRTKVEIYGDVPRNKTNVMSAAPVNYKEYNAMLIKRIQDATGVGVKKEN